MATRAHRLESFTAILVALASGCRPSPVPAAAQSTPPSETAPAPTAFTAPSAPSALPGAPDPLCALTVTRLDATRDGAPPTLGDVLASTPFVTVVSPVLDEPDCSGVGWRHLVFAPFDARHPDGLIRAHRALHLPAPVPEHAPYYLLGGVLDAAHVVNLRKVCVSFESEVNARVDWVLPLRDREEAMAWAKRLAHPICGRELD